MKDDTPDPIVENGLQKHTETLERIKAEYITNNRVSRGDIEWMLDLIPANLEVLKAQDAYIQLLKASDAEKSMYLVLKNQEIHELTNLNN